MFDEFTKNKILSGEKTVTRRLVRNNKRPAIPGSVHKIKIDRSSKTYGYIEIKSVYQELLGDLKSSDAKKEGFDSIWQYFDYFFRVNNVNSLNVAVWVVEFKKINYKGE